MKSVRRWATLAAVSALVLAALVAALAYTAAPASAFDDWAHDGAQGCVCHLQGPPTDATCTACHAGFQSYPGDTCWTCHQPGVNPDPSTAPSSACSQECHTWNAAQKQYMNPFTHGPNPHLGASSDCLACHSRSESAFDPGSSPHHSGKETGFTQCKVCHASPQKHAGKVACDTCHATAPEFHLFQANTPGFKNCANCHTKKHAGKKVAKTACTKCHKGSSGRTPQHSSTVSKKFVCSGCHKQRLHASSVSKSVRNCRTCHGGKYHARQRTPARSVCTKCHTRALSHANGYQCTLCHRRAVHNSRPSAIN